MSTATIQYMGENWEIDFDYSAGTNFAIHSASLEPNDPEEAEITNFRHETFNLSDEFLNQFFELNADEINDMLWVWIEGNK